MATNVISSATIKKTFEHLVDEAITISGKIKELNIRHIESLEQDLDIIKKQLYRELDSSGTKTIEGKLGRATNQTTNRKSYKIQDLCTDLKITESTLDLYTSKSKSSFVRITPKKNAKN